MKIALIADSFPPMRSSAATQLLDLSMEFANQGHKIVVVTPSSDIAERFICEKKDGVNIIRVKCPKYKDVNHFKRTLAEFLMPYLLYYAIQKSDFNKTPWDGVVWYSPSIFYGPLINAIKKRSCCRSYLIVRDIFPEWALEMGLMQKGLTYYLFKAIANYQYSLADVIGIQSEGNSIYFENWVKRPNRRIDVLHNWLSQAPEVGCQISINNTRLAKRRIFVYAGNMGVAQNMDILIDLAEQMMPQNDLGFLFVGRGSEVQRIRKRVILMKLDNVLFYDEVEPNEIPSLYSQCMVGLISLDTRHKSHNIPGKFLSYMQAGLPVLAAVNEGTDLVNIISTARVGECCTSNSANLLAIKARKLIDAINVDPDFTNRCHRLAAKMFSPKVAVQKIVSGLTY